MLSEQKVCEMSARRTWVVLPAMSVGIGALFLYFPLMGYFREPLTSLAVSRFGESARDPTAIALILPAFAILLPAFYLADKYAARIKTSCPACDADISTRASRVLATRSCPGCGERILGGGRTHSAAAYKRYQAIRSRRFLKHWFWAWPALGGLAMTWQMFDRSAFQCSPQGLWLCPLVGAVTAGWAWFRTLDRRYLPPLLASVVLLGLGEFLFWEAL